MPTSRSVPSWPLSAGWQMPISYAGSGVVAEHTAVRDAVGVFDVSHLGKATVTGPGAAGVREPLPVRRSRPDRARARRSTPCAATTPAASIDDLIAYLVSATRCSWCPTRPTPPRWSLRWRPLHPIGVEMVDRHRDFGVLAVQGPQSTEVVADLGLPTELDYMAWADGVVDGCAGPGVPDRLHRRARLRTAADLGRRPRPVGRAGRPAVLVGGRPAPGWAPGTPCAPRWATHCTVRISPPRSRPCRPGPAGRWGGRRSRSSVGTRLLAEKAAGPTRSLRGLASR